MLSTSLYESKTLNHTLARLFSILVLFLLPYVLLDADRQIGRAMTLGLTGALAITLLLIAYDYLRINGFLDLGVVPHIGTDEELLATVRGYINRARGGSYEPGHDASVVAAILPVALTLVGRQFRLAVAIGVCSFVYLLGYSSSLVIWLALFLCTFLLADHAWHSRIRLATIFRLLVVVAVALGLAEVLGVSGDLADKFVSTSYLDRANSFQDILVGGTKDQATFFTGYGPGGYMALDLGMVTNTFGGLILDLGVFGFTLYILIVVHAFFRILKLRDPLFMAGFVAYAVVFLNAIGDYWFPTHWLLFFYPCFALAASTRGTANPATVSARFIVLPRSINVR